jgi:ribosome-binding factor A
LSRRRFPQANERRYPRTARVNELLREVIADELERLSDADERLELVTVTGVAVDGDLRHATVLCGTLSDEAVAALDSVRIRLQASIARQIRLKRTPQLAFVADPAVVAGDRVEGILREIRDTDQVPGGRGEAGTDDAGGNNAGA